MGADADAEQCPARRGIPSHLPVLRQAPALRKKGGETLQQDHLLTVIDKS